MNEPRHDFPAAAQTAEPTDNSADRFSSPADRFSNPADRKNSPADCPAPDAAAGDRRWFLLRAAYGQEVKGNEILRREGIETFCPRVKEVREVNGQKRTVERSLVPNLLFARSTEAELRLHTAPAGPDFLHFYFVSAERTLASGTTVKARRPLVIPDDQMEQFMQWHAVEDDHKCVVPLVEAQVKLGMEVEITQGKFAGLRGRVARLRGQTRVAIRIDGLGTIFTAYIPKPFLRALHEGEPEQPQK